MRWAGIGYQGLKTGRMICVLIPDPRFPAFGAESLFQRFMKA